MAAVPSPGLPQQRHEASSPSGGFGLPTRRLEALLAARSAGSHTAPQASALPPSPAELDRLGRAVLRLQRGLTGERSLAGASYMDDPELLDAYLLYYWPVSYAQATRALTLSGLRPSSVLDLGSGPGPMAAAAIDRGAARAMLVDKSPGALALAERLLAPSPTSVACLELDEFARDGGPALAPGSAQGGGAAIEDGEGFELICFGHSLNEFHAGESGRVELRAALVERAAGRLADGGSVLIIDPATLAAARDAIALRDALCARGWRVIAPCTTDAPCPALAAGPSHSCHDEAAWAMPGFVEALAAKAGLDRALIKMSWFALRPPERRARPGATSSDTAAQPTPGPVRPSGPAEAALPDKPVQSDAALPSRPPSPAPGKTLYRVVSEPMLNKAGRVRRLICGTEGRFPLSAKRGDDNAEKAGFFGLGRYDLIEVDRPELREGGWGIATDTRIHVAQNPERGLV
jgi:SAM-dependent methyltransferase